MLLSEILHWNDTKARAVFHLLFDRIFRKQPTSFIVKLVTKSKYIFSIKQKTNSLIMDNGKGIYSQTKKKEKATTTTTTQKEIKRKEETKNCSAKTKSCYPRPRPAVESCWILGDWIDRIPSATIYSLTETAPLTERVRSLQMLCLPENEPVWEFAMYVPTHRMRKPGRQRTLFINYIHCLLGDPDSLLNDNQLLEKDRHRWRKLMVDCSATEGWWR